VHGASHPHAGAQPHPRFASALQAHVSWLHFEQEQIVFFMTASLLLEHVGAHLG
jgi:hypothetical protein